jgi:hypothetical protein
VHRLAGQRRTDPIQRDVVARTLDRRFTLRSPDSAVFDAVRFLDCTPEIPGTLPQDVLVAIEPDGNQYRIVENGRLINEASTPKVIVEHLHVHLFRCSIEDRPRAALLHAASLRRGDRRLLLAGSKSAGKTTLALRMIQSGYEIEGDEHVLIEGTLVIARPRACRVKTAALPILDDMAKLIACSPSYTDETNGTIFNVDPRTLGSTWIIEEGTVDVVIVLQPNHGGQSSIRPLPPSALLQLLMPEVGLRETGRGLAIGAITALAGRVRAFELSLGDHAGAMRCIEFAMNA